MFKRNYYDDDLDINDGDEDLNNDSNGSGEKCDPDDTEEYYNSDDIKIIETNIEGDPNIDGNSKYFVKPKDITINTSLFFENKPQHSPEKLDQDEDDNFFEIHGSEYDAYPEADNYGYELEDNYLRGCKEVKRCKKACNRVHRTLCVEFNCNKLRTTFKRMCQDKCEESFSDNDDDTEQYDEYYL